MDLRDHLVDIVPELVDVFLLDGRYEDAGDLAAVDPFGLDLVEREVLLGLGLKREFIVGLVGRSKSSTMVRSGP